MTISTDIATAPSARGEFARAWPVLIAAATGVGLGVTGLPIYTTGQFIIPLQQAYGWGRGQSTGGLILLTIGSVCMAPIIGTLIERYGVRVVALFAQFGLCLGYFGLTLNGGSLTAFYVGWAVLAVLGAGTSPIVWTRTVASWFARSRGLALGLTLCGTGVVAVFGPGIIGAIIAAYGWQFGFYTLAAAQLVIGMPLTWTLLRPRDGVGASTGPAMALTGLSVGEAVRTRVFWQLLLAFFLLSVVAGGMIVHLPPLLADRGISHADAATALGLLGVSIIVGRLSVGALVDRFPATIVAPAFFLLPVLSCFALMQGALPVVSIMLFGLCAGAEVDLLAYLISRGFGMLHYPKIYGWGLSAFSAGAGTGPILAGWIHDTTGSYDGALQAFAAMLVATAVLIATLGKWDRG